MVKNVSELEQKLREVLKLAQDAHEISYAYPNPYVGIESPLTKALIYAQQWLKKALSEAVASDIDEARGGEKRVSAHTSQLFGSLGGEAPKIESVDDDARD